MKDFADFRATILPEGHLAIANDCVIKLNELMKDQKFDDAGDQMAWWNRSLTALITLEYLERYHNWLNS